MTKLAKITIDIDLEEDALDGHGEQWLAADFMEALVCDSSLPDWVGVISDVHVEVK